MKRGEIWTIARAGGYAGKPRPAVILQSDAFAIASLTVCGFTGDPTEAPLARPEVEPSELNGLQKACRIMVDKATTVPKSKLGTRIGRLSDADVVRLNQALIVFLELTLSQANPHSTRRGPSARLR